MKTPELYEVAADSCRTPEGGGQLIIECPNERKVGGVKDGHTGVELATGGVRETHG
jgi:hypothetical protein